MSVLNSVLYAYFTVTECWLEVKGTGDCPPPLEEHTMVSYGDVILVFGGVSRMSVDGETPFWIFNTGVCHCHGLIIHTPWSVQKGGQYNLVLPIDGKIASRTLDKKRPMYWCTHTRNISRQIGRASCRERV